MAAPEGLVRKAQMPQNPTEHGERLGARVFNPKPGAFRNRGNDRHGLLEVHARFTMSAVNPETLPQHAVRPQQPLWIGLAPGLFNELLRNVKVVLPLTLETVEESETQQRGEEPARVSEQGAPIPGARQCRARLVVGRTSSGDRRLGKRQLQAHFPALARFVLG